MERVNAIKKDFIQHSEVKDFLKGFNLINITIEVEQLRKSWKDIATLIRDHWPNYSGAQAAYFIQSVLLKP